jgi:PAS domain S-box-containing protein
MAKYVSVNFHCHTIFSDGEQTPEALAAHLAQAGVRYAALTDHDTVEGLQSFEDAARKRAIAIFSGVEITTRLHHREAHVLAYGFDADHPDLIHTLRSLRQIKSGDVYSITDSLRKAGLSHSNSDETEPAHSAAPNGILDIGDAIDLIHRAGGRVFWAHPLQYEADIDLLDLLVNELKNRGLDGIEVTTDPTASREQVELHKLAKKYELLICSGTDFHGLNGPGSSEYVTQMPWEDWIHFRNAVFAGPAFSGSSNSADAAVPIIHPDPQGSTSKPPRLRKRYLALRLFLPTFLAIVLFLVAFWGLVLPSMERTLLEQKRHMIRDLTDSAWSILAAYEADARSGLLPLMQAQSLAIKDIQGLRYGEEGKDYFWIQDMQARMIMHPYRNDLNGLDLSEFRDARGIPIFLEFTSVVQRQGEGYVDYVWQWNDNPERLEAKESYVRGFEPWGWIIGTGLYIEDVEAEIARIERSLIHVSLAISSAIILLLLFVLQQSIRIERERQEVVDDLRESTERYHSLVEATTEGTLLVLDDRCRYANHTFMEMLGYTNRQLEFLELVDLLPAEVENQAIWERVRTIDRATIVHADSFEGYLLRSDGKQLECVVSLTPIEVAGHRGFILLAKEIAGQLDPNSDYGLGLAAHNAPVAIFRAQAARRAIFLELNQESLAILNHLPQIEQAQRSLADLFTDPEEYQQVFKTLYEEGQITSHIIHIESSDATTRFFSLSARLVRGDQNKPIYICGVIQDVTELRKHEVGREALIEKLQSSLLFLHEPLSTVQRKALTCPMETSIEQLARLMTHHNATAALVASEKAAVLGIITDHDLRERALAENVERSAPIYTIMSAPVTRIPDQALIYEALMYMEERGVRHLAVENSAGEITGVIDSKSLIQFQRYGPIVLAREISKAKSEDELAQCCQRILPLTRTLLDSSAQPRQITRMLASLYDAATERLIQLAVQTLGPPPARFAFIAMGSQGRQETTLATDQDNGIIYGAAPPEDAQRVEDYFLSLGARVCEGLDRLGYRLCQGGVMASSPFWCRSLPDWLRAFDQWVQQPEPQKIIDLVIFFDFRTVYGDAELTHSLREHVYAVLKNNPALFNPLAENVQTFKPPFRLLGNIYLTSGVPERLREINLKDTMMPLIGFARLYALQNQIPQTNTTARIETLAERKAITLSSRDEIIASYDFLMQLRLKAQLEAISSNEPAENNLHLGKSGYIQQELMKQAFAQIAAVQKKVEYDFLGG